MFVVSDTLLEKTLCPKCNNYSFVKSIKVYQNHGFLCGRCSTPEDEGVLSLANVFTSKALFPCVNRFEGCGQLLTSADVKNHEKICKPRYQWNCFECATATNLTTLQLYLHYKQCHKTLFFHGDEIVILLKNGLDIPVYLYRKDNLLFFIFIKWHPCENAVSVNVAYLGDAKVADTVHYKLILHHLTNEKDAFTCTVTGACTGKEDILVLLRGLNVKYGICNITIESTQETLAFLSSLKKDASTQFETPSASNNETQMQRLRKMLQKNIIRGPENVKTFDGQQQLVDYLISQRTINNEQDIEAFKCVDRAHFILPEDRSQAHRLASWINGNLHIYSPETYAKVLENLAIYPHEQFLHIGCGTGYFNTVVGTKLRPQNENNVGVDISDDIISYANERVNEFASKYHPNFSKPVFYKHNILLDDEGPLKELRFVNIFCGATCLRTDLPKLTRFLKSPGRIIVPVDHKLLLIIRWSPIHFEEKVLLKNITIPPLVRP